VCIIKSYTIIYWLTEQENRVMTPPIGFRTGKKNEDPKGPIAEIRPPAATADMTAPTTTISDYAYRIAALTAGIALLASIW
jgi:hypothetical protein